jgi:hypothetical protein
MKREAPAVARNRDPILGVLKDVLPDSGTVLEIAAGTGEHAAYFASRFPALEWRPTDADETNLPSIAAWVAETDAPNLKAPERLDVTQRPWPVERARAIVCINMIHISPWACTLALLDGAGRVLEADGVLYLYGPFRIEGTHTAPSNADFDGWLKNQNAAWGVRDLESVIATAAAQGLVHERTVAMPANNFSVVFRKT